LQLKAEFSRGPPAVWGVEDGNYVTIKTASTAPVLVLSVPMEEPQRGGVGMSTSEIAPLSSRKWEIQE